MRLVALAVAVLVSTAHGEPAATSKPWAKGVAEAEQTRALEIYRRGNGQFEDAHYTEALALYREAITHWDHPAIRFNMVVCLINLDQPLEAYDDLEKALHFGADPLGSTNYEQGLTYRKLLLAQLATVEIKSSEAHAEIRFDGAVVFTAPGDVTKLVVPGNHQVVATKPGFQPTTMAITLVGGKTTVADVKLTPVEHEHIVRRWAPWKPWTLAGAGAVIAIVGGVLEDRAYNNFNNYNTRVAAACPSGCSGPVQMALPSSLTSLKSRAELENGAAVSMFVVGGVALAAGLFGLYLDQPYTERSATVTPVVTGTGASLVLGGTF